MKKRYILIAIILFIVCIFNVKALNTEDKLYDNADIFTIDEEKIIRQKINEYIKKNDSDLVVVSTSINMYNDTDKFMERFYQDNNFGFTSKKSGTIFVIDLDNNIFSYIAYGDANQYLDDKRIDKIYDYIEKRYKDNNKDYYVLVTSFIEQLDYYMNKGIPDSYKNTYVSDDGVLHIKKNFPFLIVSLIAIGIATITTFIFAHKSKMIRKANDASSYLDDKDINITARFDRFITTHTTRVRKSSNNSSGGHSGGIGSSHSSSHGGRSL